MERHKQVHEASGSWPAGLWGGVSLAKGCYMGQETLAKVFNLNATRRRLASVRMGAAAAVGSPIMLGTLHQF